MGISVSVPAGRHVDRACLAIFSDLRESGSAQRMTARINWGDGAQSDGEIGACGDRFRVLGSHEYRCPGNYSVLLSLNNERGAVPVRTTIRIGSRGERYVAAIYSYTVTLAAPILRQCGACRLFGSRLSRDTRLHSQASQS